MTPGAGAVDPRLRAVIEEVEATGAPVELLDAEWSLVWVSEELKGLLGSDDEEQLGYGRHILERYQRSPWRSFITDESAQRAFGRNVPLMMSDTPGGKDAIERILGDEIAPLLRDVEPERCPPFWSFEMDVPRGDLPPGRVWCHSARLYDENGEFFGIIRLYAAGLRARLLALVARGDEELFERMARVVDPAPRAAAVVFADLQSSGVVARRLSSAAYFEFIRAMSSAIDAVVIDNDGIVGKHAGDGATSFFLTEDLGSDSAAARAAIDAARRMRQAAREVAEGLTGDGLPIEPDDCLLNIGAHWGAALYIGQVVTGGRLEVTALGDEVNQCARIQQAAREGDALASKDLVERLADDDASALGIDRVRLRYSLVSELPGADEKVKRDAGGVAVTDIGSAEDAHDEDDPE